MAEAVVAEAVAAEAAAALVRVNPGPANPPVMQNPRRAARPIGATLG